MKRGLMFARAGNFIYALIRKPGEKFVSSYNKATGRRKFDMRNYLSEVHTKPVIVLHQVHIDCVLHDAPEEINDYMKVTSPSLWLVMAAKRRVKQDFPI